MRSRVKDGPRSERGSGTVLMTGVIAALLVVALGVAGLMSAQAVAGRARAAADLAALGGATALTSVRAPGDPCAVAERVAAADAAVLRSCEVSGEDVTVEVGVEVRVLGVGRVAVGVARAGPVDG
ncbi:Rv3654c family TadE-like protein [Actinomyces radicidentis]|uniref:Rv3654c family TadE-like protein n=1 Tax=Actinomyces radicidentis TaxID=111015 RepID=UPI0028E3468D|nr:Rv3654c family TadE-like protein [Actinomyces radicidentis]